MSSHSLVLRQTDNNQSILVAAVTVSRLLLLVSLLLLLLLPPQEYVQYFKHVLGRSVSWGDRLEFINGWYILLIISDAFTIIGSFIKIGIESKVNKK